MITRRARLPVLSAAIVLLGAWAAVAQPAPEWETLRAAYACDVEAPLDARVDAVQDDGRLIRERLSFAGVGEERVPALLIRPSGAERPPCVLFLHGLGGDKSQAELVATLLAPQGLAVLGIDAALHGERAVEGEGIGGQLARDPQALVRTVIDNRRAIDYIVGRADLRGERPVLVGVSMGAILGSIVAAVDGRVGAAALLVGGGGWETILSASEHPAAQRLREARLGEGQPLGLVDPVNFVGHISPRPVLMVNGRDDRIIPPEAAQALHEAAAEPKTIVWYDGGHVNIPPRVLADVISWIANAARDAAVGDELPAVEGSN